MMAGDAQHPHVAPAQAGTQWCWLKRRWIPACAGTTDGVASTTRRALVTAVAVLATLLFSSVAVGQTKAAPAAGPSWNQLSPQQREALAPLAGDWAAMPAENKRKWIEIANKYPQLSPEGKERLQARMAEFAKLTPEQKRTARENFQRAYELPRESRESAVQQFQALPEDQKKELSERSQQRKPAAKAPEQKK